MRTLPQIELHLERAVEILVREQREDGLWHSEIEGDSTAESDYLLMKWITHQEREQLADGSGADTLLRIVASLREQQREDGSWGNAPHAPTDLSASVKAYFCLKLFGDSPSAPHMKRARAVILQWGGAAASDSCTKFFLAALAQISWNRVPSVPPEIIDLPRWFPLHIEQLSAWSRAQLLALSILSMRQPTRTLSPALSIDELFVRPSLRRSRRATRTAACVDALLKWAHRFGPIAWRQGSINRASLWIETNQRETEASSASLILWQLALHSLGYARQDPKVQRAEHALDARFIVASSTIRVQPCVATLHETVSALRALMECGFTAADACTKRALANLSMHEVSLALNASDAASTAILLDRMGASNAHALSSRIAHSLLTQQNTDGGWSFTGTSEPSTLIASLPCADALQLQDQSRVDITGSVLEFFSARAITIDHASVRDAIAYLKSTQHADGFWTDPDGNNRISNTTRAVSGAIACGENPAEPWLQRAADWITSIQRTDGSFSDSTAHNHQQPSTAAATAAAATLLLDLQGKDDHNLHRAIEWLCTTQLDAASAADPLSNPNQTPAGSWSQPHATTAVLPGLPTARNHSAALHLATTALGKFLAAHGAGMRGKRLTDRSVRAALLG